jgi:hypothetical protein
VASAAGLDEGEEASGVIPLVVAHLAQGVALTDQTPLGIIGVLGAALRAVGEGNEVAGGVPGQVSVTTPGVGEGRGQAPLIIFVASGVSQGVGGDDSNGECPHLIT